MATTQDQLRDWTDQKDRVFEARGVGYLKGHDWFQVSAAEQEFFELDPANIARVLVIFKDEREREAGGTGETP